MTWRLGLSICGLVVALLAYFAPLSVTPRAAPGQNACVAELHYLQRKKDEWAARVKAGPDAEPTPADLFGTNWLGHMPTCPAGETNIFTIGKIREKPTCTLSNEGHKW